MWTSQRTVSILLHGRSESVPWMCPFEKYTQSRLFTYRKRNEYALPWEAQTVEESWFLQQSSCHQKCFQNRDGESCLTSGLYSCERREREDTEKVVGHGCTSNINLTIGQNEIPELIWCFSTSCPIATTICLMDNRDYWWDEDQVDIPALVISIKSISVWLKQ